MVEEEVILGGRKFVKRIAESETTTAKTTAQIEEDIRHIEAEIRLAETKQERDLPDILKNKESELTDREAEVETREVAVVEKEGELAAKAVSLEVNNKIIASLTNKVNSDAEAIALKERELEDKIEAKAYEFAEKMLELNNREKVIKQNEEKVKQAMGRINVTLCGIDEMLAKAIREMSKVKQRGIIKLLSSYRRQLPPLLGQGD